MQFWVSILQTGSLVNPDVSFLRHFLLSEMYYLIKQNKLCNLRLILKIYFSINAATTGFKIYCSFYLYSLSMFYRKTLDKLDLIVGLYRSLGRPTNSYRPFGFFFFFNLLTFQICEKNLRYESRFVAFFTCMPWDKGLVLNGFGTVGYPSSFIMSRAGLMLLLSLFSVCTQWPGLKAKLLSSRGSLHQLVQEHRDHWTFPSSRCQAADFQSVGLYGVKVQGGK